jgi:hypothetical protein
MNNIVYEETEETKRGSLVQKKSFECTEEGSSLIPGKPYVSLVKSQPQHAAKT